MKSASTATRLPCAQPISRQDESSRNATDGTVSNHRRGNGVPSICERAASINGLVPHRSYRNCWLSGRRLRVELWRSICTDRRSALVIRSIAIPLLAKRGPHRFHKAPCPNRGRIAASRPSSPFNQWSPQLRSERSDDRPDRLLWGEADFPLKADAGTSWPAAKAPTRRRRSERGDGRRQFSRFFATVGPPICSGQRYRRSRSVRSDTNSPSQSCPSPRMSTALCSRIRRSMRIWRPT